MLQRSNEKRYHVSVVFLIFLVFFLPFLRGDERLTWVAFQCVFCILLILGIFLMSRNRITLLIACILAIPAFEIGWVAVAVINPALYEYALILGICFITVLVASVLSELMSVRKYERWILPAFVSLYLLLITVWGMGYLLLYLIYPEFFVSTAGDGTSVVYIGDIFTFSSSTLVPAGYPPLIHTISALSHLPVIESLTGTLCIITIFMRIILLLMDTCSSAQAEHGK